MLGLREARTVCFWKGRVPAPTPSPAALTRSGCPTRAGAAGRRAGRRPGWLRCAPTSQCGKRGTCPPLACRSAPGGARGRAGMCTQRARTLGTAQGTWVSAVPSPSPWPAPSWLWLRASSARRRCCSSGTPVTEQHIRARAIPETQAGGSATCRHTPYCFGPRAQTAAPLSACRRQRISCRKEFSSQQGKSWGVPGAKEGISHFPPPSWQPTCSHRSSRIFFLALASLYRLSPS